MTVYEAEELIVSWKNILSPKSWSDLNFFFIIAILIVL